VGYVEYGSTSCFEQVVVMDELAGEIRFILEGIDVSKEALALEVIDQVGPGGEYVTNEHTYRHFREGWFPALVGDRHTHEDWVQMGGKTLGDRASEKVREVLASHIPEPLPEAIEAKLKALITDAENRSR
jgi:trimethylamine--corrinoid protein Co-methyltransferase